MTLISTSLASRGVELVKSTICSLYYAKKDVQVGHNNAETFALMKKLIAMVTSLKQYRISQNGLRSLEDNSTTAFQV